MMRIYGGLASGGSAKAEDVSFTPSGGIASTDVQAAVEELDTEKNQLENDEWMTGDNFAGTDVINMFKVNTDDEIDCGGTFRIGSIESEVDSGAVVLYNLPVSASPAAGTEQSGSIRIDGDNILKFYAEADSAGGVENRHIEQDGNKVTTTDATVTTCGVVTLDASTVYRIQATVIGRETDDTNRALYHLEGLFYRAAGGAVQEGSTTSITTIESDSNWACVFDLSGNDVRVRVTGVAATTINWSSNVTINKVA